MGLLVVLRQPHFSVPACRAQPLQPWLCSEPQGTAAVEIKYQAFTKPSREGEMGPLVPAQGTAGSIHQPAMAF